MTWIKGRMLLWSTLPSFIAFKMADPTCDFSHVTLTINEKSKKLQNKRAPFKIKLGVTAEPHHNMTLINICLDH